MKMLDAAVLLAVLAFAACAKTVDMKSTAPAGVATPVALSPKPNAQEAKFVAVVSKDLLKRFPVAALAERSGYERYTAEDQDGIITYTNFRWWNDDRRHPTQLWYDARGHLIGVDYTQRVANRLQRPKLWGLQSGRWVHFIAHVHYVVRQPDGTLKYGSMLNEQYRSAGGDPAHPTAQPLVKASIAKHASDVRRVFLLPEIWITSFWVIPNARGAFADSNAAVRPTKGKHQSAHPSNM